ncbi:MAG TPA: cupin domain-containing protein [Candidatus Lachnoclostridium stercoravium]|uniref:Cupin domain-containing protein n=1 Tax=Candidatus Lachnoclostridium stercoravium TaxID=2838633 RepID=A0A9D2HGY9_9FIRM|nr:cupin domain-containing protein [Candidatus Lachnoclostridium stercoravium]
MYYKYDPEKSIHIPAPFNRTITPMFMGDDDKITETNFSVHFTEWEPGCEIDSHSHDSAMEAMYCISGSGIAEVNNEAHEFVPGSMIVAPPGIQHKIKNTGTETLRVFCIFSPPTTGADLRKRALGAVAEAGKKEE